MDIDIDRESGVPLYRQVSDGIAGLILADKLPAGCRLPAERRLARSLGVTRTTIVSAYLQLKAEGLVDAHVGRGTIVLPRRSPPAETAGVRPLPWHYFAADDLSDRRYRPFNEFVRLGASEGVVGFSAGIPGEEFVPAAAMAPLLGQITKEMGTRAFMPTPSEGLAELREALADHLAKHGLTCAAENVVITTGSEQAIDLLSRMVVERNDTVIIEESTYPMALRIFRARGARLVGVPMDDEGMRTDELETLLTRYHPKLVYTMPTFHNPTGRVLSLERRLRLLELAHRHQFPIIEDDVYAELRFSGEPLPSLAALDAHGYVVQLGSFSKVVAPGLRVGWAVAPLPVVRRLSAAKAAADLHTATLNQWLAALFIRDGHLARHRRALLRAYAARAARMDAALHRWAPESLRWTRPEGGLNLWCVLPRDISHEVLVEECLRRSVTYLPGTLCAVDGASENGMRLTFSFPTEAEIDDGIARLMEAVHAATPSGAGRTAAELGTAAVV
jgi:DNA-binding transcriptional MocR family regulator